MHEPRHLGALVQARNADPVFSQSFDALSGVCRQLLRTDDDAPCDNVGDYVGTSSAHFRTRWVRRAPGEQRGASTMLTTTDGADRGGGHVGHWQ